MSYILDALKKSEQERQKTTGPGLQSLYRPPFMNRPKTNAFWVGVSAALALSLAVVMSMWVYTGTKTPVFHPGAGTPSAPAQTTRIQQPGTVPDAHLRPAPGAAASGAATIQTGSAPGTHSSSQTGSAPGAHSSSQTGSVPGAHSSSALATAASAAATIPSRSVSGARSVASVAGQQSSVTTGAQPAPQIVPFQELPDSVQQEIPALTFSFHVYSQNPQRRTIIINKRRVKEGDTVAEGLVLETITVEGVVLKWKQFHVAINVVDQW